MSEHDCTELTCPHHGAVNRAATAENDARLAAIRAASTPSLIPGSTARFVSMRDVERIFAEHVIPPGRLEHTFVPARGTFTISWDGALGAMA